MSVFSKPDDEKGSSSQIVSPYEEGGAELFLHSPAPFPQKKDNYETKRMVDSYEKGRNR